MMYVSHQSSIDVLPSGGSLNHDQSCVEVTLLAFISLSEKPTINLFNTIASQLPAKFEVSFFVTRNILHAVMQSILIV